MVNGSIVYYMLTYYASNPAETSFRPSGVIVNEAGTARFDFRIDDVATEEVVIHYVELIKNGACVIPVEKAAQQAMASLRANIAQRDYSKFDKRTLVGNAYQAFGELSDILRMKYDAHVVAGRKHPDDMV